MFHLRCRDEYLRRRSQIKTDTSSVRTSEQNGKHTEQRRPRVRCERTCGEMRALLPPLVVDFKSVYSVYNDSTGASTFDALCV